MSALTCRQAIDAAFEAFGKDAASWVAANGYISREAFDAGDPPGTFYMIGSMGLAPSIALGAALARPERTIVVLDGDGNVLMGLGALPVIAAARPRRLHHLVLDNGVYASTGNQATVAPGASLQGIALAAGYAYTACVHDEAALRRELAALPGREGPTFLRIMVQEQPHPRSFGRVTHTPVQIRDRFARGLQAT